MSMEYRALGRDEYEKIPSEALDGMKMPDTGLVFAAVDEAGGVAAIWAMIPVVHLEPLWISAEHRKSPTIIRRLWNLVSDAMSAMGLKAAVAVILDSKVETRRVADWLGAEELPGRVFMVTPGRK